MLDYVVTYKDGKTPLSPIVNQLNKAKISREQQDSAMARGTASSPTSVWVRLGTATILIVLGATVVIIAAAGLLSFLWFGSGSNNVWQQIILNGWATRTVTLTSIALRTAVAMQGGACLAMIVAITLENSAVPVGEIGPVSIMRAGQNTDLWSMLSVFVWPMVRRGPNWGLGQAAVPTVLLVLTAMTFSQFFSTILLSDILLKPLPGWSSTVNATFDFAYHATSITVPDRSTNGSTNETLFASGYDFASLSATSLWASQLPTFWPMFAEYSEPPANVDNISDTGVSLRAFLPLQSQADRSSIRNYTGKALVLDSRVTCQKPVLTDIQVDLSSELGPNFGILSGSVSPSTATPRQDTVDAVPFTCSFWFGDWSICELRQDAIVSEGGQFSGGLVSEFREFPLTPGQNKSGAAFLILSGGANNISNLEDQPEFAYPIIVNDTNVPDVPWAVTLCYTSLDTADRWINAYSDLNRTEPTAAWEMTTALTPPSINLTAVASQLDTGYANGTSPPSVEERGIMSIQPLTNWSAPDSNQLYNDGPSMVIADTNLPVFIVLPFITLGLHLVDNNAILNGATPPIGNFSAIMNNFLNGEINSYIGVQPDPWLVDLFNYFMTNRSPSIALQSIITTLAGIEYYNRLQQFDKSDPVSQVFFVDAITPGGAYGQRRTTLPYGFIAVMAFLVFHMILVFIITIRFIAQTAVTRIGDTWQAIAQVAKTKEVVLISGLDNIIQKGARRNGMEEAIKANQSSLRNSYAYISDESGVRLRKF